jgi:hypothetical protein
VKSLWKKTPFGSGSHHGKESLAISDLMGYTYSRFLLVSSS